MKKIYDVEIYYYSDKSRIVELKEEPVLDQYLAETTILQVVSNSWEETKRKILDKFPNAAYIYVHETRNMNI